MPTATASPGTLASDNSFGTAAWSNPGNAAASDNVYATASLAMNSSQYLKATNFGFAIPNTAVVLGIKASIERKATGDITDSRVRLVKAGTIQTTDKSAAAAWPASDTVADFGGAADVWSDAWLGLDVNNSGFGVVFACASTSAANASVDHIALEVTYRLAGGIARQGRVLRP